MVAEPAAGRQHPRRRGGYGRRRRGGFAAPTTRVAVPKGGGRRNADGCTARLRVAGPALAPPPRILATAPRRWPAAAPGRVGSPGLTLRHRTGDSGGRRAGSAALPLPAAGGHGPPTSRLRAARQVIRRGTRKGHGKGRKG